MTVIELRRRVLEKLQVLAINEPVDVSDAQVVQKRYETLHEVLLQDGLVTWVVTDELPQSHEGALVSMLAAELVDEFYCPPDLKVKILLEGKYDTVPLSNAERRLRKLAAPGYSGEPAQSEYY